MTVMGQEFKFYLSDEVLADSGLLTRDDGERVIGDLARIFLVGIFGQSMFHRAEYSCVRDASRRAFEIKVLFYEAGWEKALDKMEPLTPVINIKEIGRTGTDKNEFWLSGRIGFQKEQR